MQPVPVFRPETGRGRGRRGRPPNSRVQDSRQSSVGAGDDDMSVASASQRARSARPAGNAMVDLEAHPAYANLSDGSFSVQWCPKMARFRYVEKTLSGVRYMDPAWQPWGQIQRNTARHLHMRAGVRELMASISSNFSVVNPKYLNQHEHTFRAGPSLSFVDLITGPEVGLRLQHCAYLVDCINNLSLVPPTCAVPTPYTRLIHHRKTGGKEDGYIIGVKRRWDSNVRQVSSVVNDTGDALSPAASGLNDGSGDMEEADEMVECGESDDEDHPDVIHAEFLQYLNDHCDRDDHENAKMALNHGNVSTNLGYRRKSALKLVSNLYTTGEDGSMDETEEQWIRSPWVSLVVRFFPVEALIVKDDPPSPPRVSRLLPRNNRNDGEGSVRGSDADEMLNRCTNACEEPTQRAAIRVITLVPQPGVNLIELVREVCDMNSHTLKYNRSNATSECGSIWHSLISKELDLTQRALHESSRDMLNVLVSQCFDDYSNRKLHPYHICSEVSIVRKAYLLLAEAGFLDHNVNLPIPGIPSLCLNSEDTNTADSSAARYLEAFRVETNAIIDWTTQFIHCTEFMSLAMRNKKQRTSNGPISSQGDGIGVEGDRDADVISANNPLLATTPDKLQFHLPLLPRPDISNFMTPLERESAQHFNFPTHDQRIFGFFEPALALIQNVRSASKYDKEYPTLEDLMPYNYPSLIRLVILKFMHTSMPDGFTDPLDVVVDPEKADEEVDMLLTMLPEKDREVVSLPRFLQRYQHNENSLMDQLTRQNCFQSWNKGIQQLVGWTRTNMSRKGEPEVDIVSAITRQYVANYKQWFQFHVANMAERHFYESTYMDDLHTLYNSVSGSYREVYDTLHENYRDWIVTSQVQDRGEYVDAYCVDSLTMSRWLFNEALHYYNSRSGYMSFSNLSVLNELYTTHTLWMLRSNETWDNFLIPIMVANQKANLYRYGQKNEEYLALEKPNSSGVDVACVGNWQRICNLVADIITTRSGMNRPVNFTLETVTRETPAAKERRSRYVITNGVRVTSKPDEHSKHRMCCCTENRAMKGELLNSYIGATPRNAMSESDGLVRSTEVGDGCNERKVVLLVPACPDNTGLMCQNNSIPDAITNEQYNTLLLVCKCMSTGTYKEPPRSYRVSRGDYTINRASGSSSQLQTSDVRKLRVILTIIPHICKGLCAFPNWLGFSSIELSVTTFQLKEYMQWRFLTLFESWVGKRHSNSVPRCFSGHIARHVADAMQNRLICDASTFTNFSDAIVAANLASSFNALPVQNLCAWLDDSIREVLDAQMLLFSVLVSEELKVPVLDLPWLYKLLSRGVEGMTPADIAEGNQNRELFIKWVDYLMYEQCFITNVVDGTLNSVGYISTPLREVKWGGDSPSLSFEPPHATVPNIRASNNANTSASAGGASSEQSEDVLQDGFIVHARSYNEAVLTLGERLRRTRAGITYQQNTGFQNFSNSVVGLSIRRAVTSSLNMPNIFEDPSLYNSGRIFILYNQLTGRNISPPWAQHNRYHGPDAARGSSTTSQGTTLARFIMAKDAQRDEQRWILGVQALKILCLRSMLGPNPPNSDYDEHVAKKVMWFILRDIPPQLTGTDGRTYLRKVFRGDNPRHDIHHILDHIEPRPAYFTRPDNDPAKNSTDTSTTVKVLPSGTYKNYIAEDYICCDELVNIARTFKTDDIRNINLREPLIMPHYLLLRGVSYVVCKTAAGLQRMKNAKNSNRCHDQYIASLRTSRLEFTIDQNFTSSSGFPSNKRSITDKIGLLEQTLKRHELVVCPTIQRHNACVRSVSTTGQPIIGIVLPCEYMKALSLTDQDSCEEDMVHNMDSPGSHRSSIDNQRSMDEVLRQKCPSKFTYYNGDESFTYRVLFSDGFIRSLDFDTLEKQLLPLNQRIYIRLDLYRTIRSTAIQCQADRYERARNGMQGSAANNAALYEPRIAEVYPTFANLHPKRSFIAAVISYNKQYPRTAEEFESIYIDLPYNENTQNTTHTAYTSTRFKTFHVSLNTVAKFEGACAIQARPGPSAGPASPREEPLAPPILLDTPTSKYPLTRVVYLNSLKVLERTPSSPGRANADGGSHRPTEYAGDGPHILRDVHEIEAEV